MQSNDGKNNNGSGLITGVYSRNGGNKKLRNVGGSSISPSLSPSFPSSSNPNQPLASSVNQWVPPSPGSGMAQTSSAGLPRTLLSPILVGPPPPAAMVAPPVAPPVASPSANPIFGGASFNQWVSPTPAVGAVQAFSSNPLAAGTGASFPPNPPQPQVQFGPVPASSVPFQPNLNSNPNPFPMQAHNQFGPTQPSNAPSQSSLTPNPNPFPNQLHGQFGPSHLPNPSQLISSPPIPSLPVTIPNSLHPTNAFSSPPFIPSHGIASAPATSSFFPHNPSPSQPIFTTPNSLLTPPSNSLPNPPPTQVSIKRRISKKYGEGWMNHSDSNKSNQVHRRSVPMKKLPPPTWRSTTLNHISKQELGVEMENDSMYKKPKPKPLKRELLRIKWNSYVVGSISYNASTSTLPAPAPVPASSSFLTPSTYSASASTPSTPPPLHPPLSLPPTQTLTLPPTLAPAPAPAPAPPTSNPTPTPTPTPVYPKTSPTSSPTPDPTPILVTDPIPTPHPSPSNPTPDPTTTLSPSAPSISALIPSLASTPVPSPNLEEKKKTLEEIEKELEELKRQDEEWKENRSREAEEKVREECRKESNRKEEERKKALEKERKIAALKERRRMEALEKEKEEKLQREAEEKERVKKRRAVEERLQKENEERERLSKEKAERERIEMERVERIRIEKEKEEKMRLEKEMEEMMRIEKERVEKERREMERRAERERRKEERARERARIEFESWKQRMETESLGERIREMERASKERKEKERQEKERVASEKEREKEEKERLEMEREEEKKREAERIERIKILEAMEMQKRRDEERRLQSNLAHKAKASSFLRSLVIRKLNAELEKKKLEVDSKEKTETQVNPKVNDQDRSVDDVDCDNAAGSTEPNQMKTEQASSTSIQSSDPLPNPEPNLLPRLINDEYYTVPSLPELAKAEAERPGYCSRVPDFVVGRRGYGEVWFVGETDVRGLDLDDIVLIQHCKASLYVGDSPTPSLGQGLNKPARVTYLNVVPTKDWESMKSSWFRTNAMILTLPLLFSPSSSHDVTSCAPAGFTVGKALERMEEMPQPIHKAFDIDTNLLQFWVPWFVDPQSSVEEKKESSKKKKKDAIDDLHRLKNPNRLNPTNHHHHHHHHNHNQEIGVRSNPTLRITEELGGGKETFEDCRCFFEDGNLGDSEEENSFEDCVNAFENEMDVGLEEEEKDLFQDALDCWD